LYPENPIFTSHPFFDGEEGGFFIIYLQSVSGERIIDAKNIRGREKTAMKHTVWNIPPAVPIPEELMRAGYTPLLSAVLARRDITTAEAAAAFLDGGPCALEDPLRMTDMAAAVQRISLACQRKEKAAVYGDYDVDGITSACLLTEYLRGIGLDTEMYIPDRLEEGYGLNNGAVKRLHDKHVTLIITVDCGVTAVEETEYARSLGVDMIITDHHECQAELPHAVAVVDPKRPECAYQNRNLAGVGVAFKLACALSGDEDKMLRQFADLVAVGTVADVMPLVGENRYMVKVGLQKLKERPRPGLAALMDEAGLQRNRLGASSIGFTLAPRINAAGRLGLVKRAADLMLAQSAASAAALAAELCDMNRQRQSLEAEIWEQAAQMLDGQMPQGPIVLAGEGWHQGVIGIAASRLSETYSVPAVMISLDGDKGKGSCRSYGGFNLFDALSSCEELLDGFGGHALAAGLNIPRENIGAFREALRNYYVNHTPQVDETLSPDVLIDSKELLTMECVDSLEALEPCGSGNPRPTFCMMEARLVSVTPIGGGKHVRLRLEKFGQGYDCVWFSHRANELGVSVGDRVDVVFFPQISEFRGRRTVQLLVQEMRRADTSELCRRILSGEDVTRLYLNRGELVRIWRSLVQLCPLHVSLRRLGMIEPRLHPAKIALGLRVLWEVGLVELHPLDHDMSIMLTKKEEKADLTQSASWQKYHG
jgi:single-stranded-DNA-specific exonuclease